MNYNVFCALDSLKCFFDKVFARLHQHLNRNIVGNIVSFNQRAQNFIFRFRGRRKSNLNLFNAYVDKRLEKL